MPDRQKQLNKRRHYMKLTKGIVSAGVITAVAAGSVVGVSAVNAHGDGSNKDELIDRIAADAGVDRETIEASFTAHREEMKAEREAAKDAHLDNLVEDGTLTAEQREALEARFEERKEAMQALKESGASREEIRSAKQESREEFKAWAEEQGINLEDVKPEGQGFGGRGHRHMHFHGDSSDES